MRHPLLAALLSFGLMLPAGASFAERPETSESAGKARVSSKGAQRKSLSAAMAAAAVARAEMKAGIELAMTQVPKRGRVWCVPFARNATGVSLRGNATTWWHKAKGVYDRGSKPQIGAVMNFRGSRKMPMGHVAVVSNILDARTIQIDHANWVRNKVTLDQTVIDVSAKNDWSEVRVVNADGSLGRTNPVWGFIYN